MPPASCSETPKYLKSGTGAKVGASTTCSEIQPIVRHPTGDRRHFFQPWGQNVLLVRTQQPGEGLPIDPQRLRGAGLVAAELPQRALRIAAVELVQGGPIGRQRIGGRLRNGLRRGL